MSDLLQGAVRREVLESHDGRSGARIERVVLDDGRRLLVKRSRVAEDVTVALTGGVQREHALWRSGAFDRLPAGVGHAIIDAYDEGDTAVTVMRDLGDSVPGWSRILAPRELDRILDAMAAVHVAYAGRVPSPAASLEQRVGLLSVERLGSLAESEPLGRHVARGWTLFAEQVDAEIAERVAALLADPTPIIAALRQAPQTLIHADLWLVNLALTPGEVVLLDWALATEGPAALDLALFLTGSIAHIAASPEDVIAAFRTRSPETDDRTLALALLAGLVDGGWNKALDAAEHLDATVRARQAAELAWWVDRGRAGLLELDRS